MGQAPGFFGKVPSHGDFVGRRLPPDVRQCFDDWLQASLVRSKQDLGDEWLPIWLSSPLWRFVVGAGVCGEQAWAGVMMPSHDRVGRCYPLLLMAGIDGTPSLRDCLTVHDGWFGQLEKLALSAVEAGFLLDQFDAGLVALGDGAFEYGWSPHPDEGTAIGEPDEAVFTVEMFDIGAGFESSREISVGQSAWWSDGSSLVSRSLAICGGLPWPEIFAAFLDGAWAKRGIDQLDSKNLKHHSCESKFVP